MAVPPGTAIRPKLTPPRASPTRESHRAMKLCVPPVATRAGGLEVDAPRPKLAAALKKIHTNSKTQIKELKKQLAEREAKEAAREQAEASRAQHEGFQRVEDAFASLPEKYRKIVGDGYVNEITDPKAKKKAESIRGKILATLGVNNFATVPGDRVIKRNIIQAIDDLYEGLLEADDKAPPTKAHPTEEEWEGAGLKVPSDPPPSLSLGKQAFLKAAKKKLAEINQAS